MILGVVLAGGRSRRFGREKAMEAFAGAPMIAWVLQALSGGTDRLAINARPGSEAAGYANAHGLTCLTDAPDAVDGPLAGVQAGLRWAAATGADWLATAPCDTPRLPGDLVARLRRAARPGGAVARTGAGLEPLCALWAVTALDTLNALEGHPPLRHVLQALDVAEVAFDDASAFVNLNTPADFQAAQMRLQPIKGAGRPLGLDDAQQQQHDHDHQDQADAAARVVAPGAAGVPTHRRQGADQREDQNDE